VAPTARERQDVIDLLAHASAAPARRLPADVRIADVSPPAIVSATRRADAVVALVAPAGRQVVAVRVAARRATDRRRVAAWMLTWSGQSRHDGMIRRAGRGCQRSSTRPHSAASSSPAPAHDAAPRLAVGLVHR